MVVLCCRSPLLPVTVTVPDVTCDVATDVCVGVGEEVDPPPQPLRQQIATPTATSLLLRGSRRKVTRNDSVHKKGIIHSRPKCMGATGRTWACDFSPTLSASVPALDTEPGMVHDRLCCNDADNAHVNVTVPANPPAELTWIVALELDEPVTVMALGPEREKVEFHSPIKLPASTEPRPVTASYPTVAEYPDVLPLTQAGEPAAHATELPPVVMS